MKITTLAAADADETRVTGEAKEARPRTDAAARVKQDAKGQFARPDDAQPNPGGAASADPAVLGGDGEETASDWDAGAEDQSDPSLPKRWK